MFKVLGISHPNLTVLAGLSEDKPSERAGQR
jgi:hypothetical protein